MSQEVGQGQQWLRGVREKSWGLLPEATFRAQPSGCMLGKELIRKGLGLRKPATVEAFSPRLPLWEGLLPTWGTWAHPAEIDRGKKEPRSVSNSSIPRKARNGFQNGQRPQPSEHSQLRMCALLDLFPIWLSGVFGRGWRKNRGVGTGDFLCTHSHQRRKRALVL